VGGGCKIWRPKLKVEVEISTKKGPAQQYKEIL